MCSECGGVGKKGMCWNVNVRTYEEYGKTKRRLSAFICNTRIVGGHVDGAASVPLANVALGFH